MPELTRPTHTSAPNPSATPDTLLEVDGLTTAIQSRGRTLHAVEDVSFSVGRGEILGLVGESGCGKSMTALSLIRLLPPGASVTGGSVRFDGRDLLKLSNREMRNVRGNGIAMVF